MHVRRDFGAFPAATPLPLPPRALQSAGSAAAINTVSVDALHESLSHLKRAYWPYAWDTGRAAATSRLLAAAAPRRAGGQTLGSFGGFWCARRGMHACWRAAVHACARTR
jgi:hypothetical protein